MRLPVLPQYPGKHSIRTVLLTPLEKGANARAFGKLGIVAAQSLHVEENCHPSEELHVAVIVVPEAAK